MKLIRPFPPSTSAALLTACTAALDADTVPEVALAFLLRRSVDLAPRCAIHGTPMPSPEACPCCAEADEALAGAA